LLFFVILYFIGVIRIVNFINDLSSKKEKKYTLTIIVYLVRKDVNVHERLSNITVRHKLNEQLKDMDVNEHERLSNITVKLCSFT
jgi:phage-related holin